MLCLYSTPLQRDTFVKKESFPGSALIICGHSWLYLQEVLCPLAAYFPLILVSE